MLKVVDNVDSTCVCVCFCAVRENLRAAKKEFNKTEDDLKSLQSVGQIIGEVLRPLDNERCNYPQKIYFYFLHCTCIHFYVLKYYVEMSFFNFWE